MSNQTGKSTMQTQSETEYRKAETFRPDPRGTDIPGPEVRIPEPEVGARLDESATGIGGLIRQLGREVPSLVTKELALAKVEITEAINATKTATGAVAGGGAVLLAGFIVLLQAAVYALNLVMDAWLAAFIVGAVVSVVGYAMIQAGKKKFEPSALKPERTLHSLQKDKAAIKEATR